MRAITIFISACLAIPSAARPTDPMTAAGAAIDTTTTSLERGEGRAVAARLANDLAANFVDRDQAKAYAAMLSKNAAGGRYDHGTRGVLAKLMTDDLQAVHKDGHLRIDVVVPGKSGSGDRSLAKKFPPLVQSAKTIAPGIGYIRFSAFSGTKEEMDIVGAWLMDNRNAQTLIFDLRNHHGGGIDEQDLIFTSLFAKKTALVRMALAQQVYERERRDFPTEEAVATHFAIPGADTPLRHATVYLLISNQTASAAEHFSLALKSTRRATLIGEPTAGANHFGGPAPLNEHFTVWMPVGRTYDITTGKDWEGAGIAPDIAVDPKDALVVALERSGVGVEEAVRLDKLEVPAEPIHSDKLRAR